MLYGCQKGAPVAFTCRTPKVDQPRACPVNTLHTSSLSLQKMHLSKCVSLEILPAVRFGAQTEKGFCCFQTRVKSFEWVTVDRLALDSATIELPLVVVQIWDFCHQMLITFSEKKERKKIFKSSGRGEEFSKGRETSLTPVWSVHACA